MDVGKAIKLCRKSAGLTQSQLADACSWDDGQSRVSKLETNRVQATIPDLELIAAACKVTLSRLLDESYLQGAAVIEKKEDFLSLSEREKIELLRRSLSPGQARPMVEAVFRSADSRNKKTT